VWEREGGRGGRRYLALFLTVLGIEYIIAIIITILEFKKDPQCILILCYCNFTEFVYQAFLVETLCFSTYKIMSANRGHLTPSFPICIAFISLCCLIHSIFSLIFY
jgi:hypothetical protein